MNKTTATVILACVVIVCLCVSVLVYKWIDSNENFLSNLNWYKYNSGDSNALNGGLKLVNDDY